MKRLVKRYESRKLYDTSESRYVGLDEIAGWIRDGETVRVMDNVTGEDVTAQTLTQIILEESRSGAVFPGPELLHDLVRRGGEAVETAFSSGARKVQKGVDRLIGSSLERLSPIREVRQEMARLRRRLEQLEDSLESIEPPDDPGHRSPRRSGRQQGGEQ